MLEVLAQEVRRGPGKGRDWAGGDLGMQGNCQGRTSGAAGRYKGRWYTVYEVCVAKAEHGSV